MIRLLDCTHLFELGQLQCVMVFRAELHESHVRRLRQLRYDVCVRKHSFNNKQFSKRVPRINELYTKRTVQL